MRPFRFFPELPPELRTRIWELALPAYIDLALHAYREGFWIPRVLDASDPAFDAALKDNVELTFRPELLCQTKYELPMAFANFESRDVAMAWIERHGLVPKNDQEHSYFVRQYDPIRDTLYVSMGLLSSFASEPYDRMAQSDLAEIIFEANAQSVTRLAVDAGLLRREGWSMELFEWFRNVTELLVVTNAQPQTDTPDCKVLPFDFCESTVYNWNSEMGHMDPGQISKESDDKWLEESLRELRGELLRIGCEEFHVRRIRLTN